MHNFLETRGIVKRYSGHTALDGVSICVPEGKIFGLLGPNGAGKTTLIRIINRITAPDEGSVFLDGQEMKADDVARIGYLPEERGLYRKMKVGEQAVYLAMLKGMKQGEAKKRLREWFDKFGIMPWWNKKLEELSKGMQQKVQFVITVLHEPQLLIFDEPFSGFDPVNAELLKNEILGLKRKGSTIIFSTHNMESVEEVCDEFALINRSKVVLSGNVAEVRKTFRTGMYDVSCRGEVELGEGRFYKVVSSEYAAGETRVRLVKTGEASNAELLGELSGRAELPYFSEQLPSMNEIFIKTVGQGMSDGR